RVLACTATATPVVRDEILARLGLPADTPQHVRGFARPNLRLRAVEMDDAHQRPAQVDAVLGVALGGPRRGAGVAIVYSPTRWGGPAVTAPPPGACCSSRRATCRGAAVYWRATRPVKPCSPTSGASSSS